MVCSKVQIDKSSNNYKTNNPFITFLLIMREAGYLVL